VCLTFDICVLRKLNLDARLGSLIYPFLLASSTSIHIRRSIVGNTFVVGLERFGDLWDVEWHETVA
jgi:hypothetical protein